MKLKDIKWNPMDDIKMLGHYGLSVNPIEVRREYAATFEIDPVEVTQEEMNGAYVRAILRRTEYRRD